MAKSELHKLMNKDKQSNAFTPVERFKILRLQQKHGFDNPDYFPENIRKRRDEDRKRKALHAERANKLPAITNLNNMNVYKDTSITEGPLM